MKIVQINAVYDVGSTGKTTAQLHKYLLENGHDSYVFWAIRSKGDKNDNKLIRIGNKFDHKLHALLSRVFHNQCFNSYFATLALIKRLKKINPDIVHLRNLHSNYVNLPLLFKYLKKNSIPTVLTLHDCWFLTAGCFHYKLNNCNGYMSDCSNCPECSSKRLKQIRKKTFALKKSLYNDISNLTVVGVSKWTSDSARRSNIFGSDVRHDYIYNWIDLNIFTPCGNRAEICKKYGINENAKIVLGVAQSWRSEKGFETFKKLSESVGENTQVVLVGDSHGRKDTQTLKFIGRTENQRELAALYSIANVFVNPSPAETFGKVTAEALACGAPVVAYNNTGTAELLQNGYGYLVEDGNQEELIKQVIETLYNDDVGKDARIEFVKNNFDFTKQAEKYVELYKDILKNRI